MILEWFLSISASSWGIPTSVSTWKQESSRLTSPDVLEHLQKHWGFYRELLTEKNQSGAPWNHREPISNLVPSKSLLHKPARNCYKPVSEETWNCNISQIWRDSLRFLSAALKCCAPPEQEMFLSPWEQTWPFHSTRVLPQPHILLPTQGRENKWGKWFHKQQMPFWCYTDTPDSSFYLCHSPAELCFQSRLFPDIPPTAFSMLSSHCCP